MRVLWIAHGHLWTNLIAIWECLRVLCVRCTVLIHCIQLYYCFLVFMIMYVSELVIFSKEIYYFYILLQPENDTRDVPRLGLASTSPRQPSQVEMCTVPGFIVLSFFSLFFPLRLPFSITSFSVRLAVINFRHIADRSICRS